MPDKIFVSYRRTDSKNAAGHVFDRVGKAFPDGLVFIDIDNIPPGHDFQRVLNRQLQASGLVLAIIGSDWLGPARDGMHHSSRRIDDPRDFVRLEIEEAIRMRVPIIPILLNEARMPAVTALPDGMRDISKCKTIAIRQSSFDNDIDMILQEITSTMPLIRPVTRPASWAGRKALSHFVIEWRKAGMPNQTIANSIRNEERMLLDITGQAVGNLLSQTARPGSKTSKEHLVAIFHSRVLLGFMLSRFMRNGRLDNDVLPKKFPTDFKNAGDLLSNWLEGQLATDEGLLRLANEDLWCDELTLELAASIWLMDFFGGQMERDIREIAADKAIGDALMQCVLMGAATHQFIHAGAPPPDQVDSSRVRMISISPPSAMTGSILLASLPGGDEIFALGRLRDRLNDVFSDGTVVTLTSQQRGTDKTSEQMLNVLDRCKILVVILPDQNARASVGDAREAGYLTGGNQMRSVENLVSAAMLRSVRIVPILLDNARMPRSQDLPDDLRKFPQFQALTLRFDRFEPDAGGITAAIRNQLEDLEAGMSDESCDLTTRQILNSFVDAWFVHGLYDPGELGRLLTAEERGLATRIASIYAVNMVDGQLNKQWHAPALGWSNDDALLVCAPKVFTGYLLDRFVQTGSFVPGEIPKGFPTGKSAVDELFKRYIATTFFREIDGFSVWGDHRSAILANYLGTKSLITGLSEQEVELRESIPGKATVRMCIARGIVMSRFWMVGAPKKLPRDLQEAIDRHQ